MLGDARDHWYVLAGLALVFTWLDGVSPPRCAHLRNMGVGFAKNAGFRWISGALIVLAVVPVAVGLLPDDDPRTTFTELRGTDTVTERIMEGQPPEPIADGGERIRFLADGYVFSDGCNSVLVDYATGSGESTLQGCGDFTPSIVSQVLGGTRTTTEFDGETLTLTRHKPGTFLTLTGRDLTVVFVGP